MKRISPLLLLSLFIMPLFITGCYITEKSIANYKACQNDDKCLAEMAMAKNISASAVATAVDSVPSVSGIGSMLGLLVGSGVSFVTGVIAGGKLKKRG